jgi:hypothetical protein
MSDLEDLEGRGRPREDSGVSLEAMREERVLVKARVEEDGVSE